MSLLKLITCVSFMVLFGCAHQDQKQSTESQNGAAVPVVERKSMGTLESYFVQRTPLVPLGKRREFKMDAATPIIQTGESAATSFPFVSFQIDEDLEKNAVLTVSSAATSQGIDRVGLSSPRIYVMKNGEIVRLKPKSVQHVSELGTCLSAKWNYSIGDLRLGTKIVVVNEAQGFQNSYGKIEVSNPNLQLNKSIGICTMVSVYPSENANYTISIQ